MSIDFVFHIGPIKTGSTSIQRFLENEAVANPKLEYKRIRPAHFYGLASPQDREASLEYFERLYQKKISQKKSIRKIVLSHECIYQKPKNIPQLIKTAQPFAKNISCIAYARKQSSHYCSHYSQFLYFNEALQKNIDQSFKDKNLGIHNFTGLETFLISLAITDFKIVRVGDRTEYQDWTRMIHIDQSLRKQGHHLDLGLLPSRAQKPSLIEDFCARSGIKKSKRLSTTRDIYIHSALPDAAVELLYQAYKKGLRTPVKKPEHLSCFQAFRQKEYNNDSLQIHDPELIKQLLNYIDSHYAERNNKLCQHFGLAEDYFLPNEYVDKKNIIEFIKSVDKLRKANPKERIEQKNKILAECARYFMLTGADA